VTGPLRGDRTIHAEAAEILPLADKVAAHRWTETGSWAEAYGRVRRFCAALGLPTPTGSSLKLRATQLASGLREWVASHPVATTPSNASLRAVHWAPDVVDWADVRALAVLARSVEGDPLLEEQSPLDYALATVEFYQYSARAVEDIARALREAAA
jgi:hypothetical protein